MTPPVASDTQRGAKRDPPHPSLAASPPPPRTPAAGQTARVALRPGPLLLACGGGLIAVALLCFLWSGAVWLIPLLLAAAVVLAVADFRALRRAWAGLTVARQLPVSAIRAAPFRCILRVGNSGPAGFLGEIRDVLPAEAAPDYWQRRLLLPPGAQTEAAIDLRIPTRGLHQFGPVWLRLRGPFGILEGQRSFHCPGAVKVVPQTALAQEGLLKDAHAEKRLLDRLSRTRLRGEGTEFECLSEFRDGDDPRRIDWRSTARLSRPVVRRYQVEQHRDLMLVLDCGRLMGSAASGGAKLDCAVDAALMLSRVALTKGDRCGVALFDDKVLGYLPPVSGPRAQHTILESLYSAQSRWREANFGVVFAALQARQIKRALVVVLSDIVDAETTHQFRRALATLAQRHVVIFAALQTPLLGETIAAPAGSMLDVCRKGVALRLLREREKALHSLRHTGVHVLDVEPQQLTVPLLNEYIALRERNLL